MKKGDLTINYVFLIFLGTITVFVILGLITKWGVNADKFMCQLTGSCEKNPELTSAKRLNVTGCPDLPLDIVKYGRICLANARQGKIKDVCYILLAPNTCTMNAAGLVSLNLSLFRDKLNDSNMIFSYAGSNRVVLSYDSYKSRLVIE